MKKSHYRYLLIIILICAICTALTVNQAYAAESKVARFFKGLFKWPFSVTKKGAETVARTAEKAVTTSIKTTTSAVETVTGKPEKLQDVIVEPVKGSAETGYTAIEGTLRTPIEGTEEAFRSEEAE